MQWKYICADYPLAVLLRFKDLGNNVGTEPPIPGY